MKILHDHQSAEEDELSLSSPLLKDVKIGQLGGLIDKNDSLTMQRMIFRALRGKASLQLFDVAPSESDEICDFSRKSAFILFYQHGSYMY